MDLATSLHCGLLRQEVSRAKTVLGLALTHLEQAYRLAPLRPETTEQTKDIGFALAHVKGALAQLTLEQPSPDSGPAAAIDTLLTLPEVNNEQN